MKYRIKEIYQSDGESTKYYPQYKWKYFPFWLSWSNGEFSLYNESLEDAENCIKRDIKYRKISMHTKIHEFKE